MIEGDAPNNGESAEIIFEWIIFKIISQRHIIIQDVSSNGSGRDTTLERGRSLTKEHYGNLHLELARYFVSLELKRPDWKCFVYSPAVPRNDIERGMILLGNVELSIVLVDD
jgi:hypothetical protein